MTLPGIEDDNMGEVETIEAFDNLPQMVGAWCAEVSFEGFYKGQRK